MLPLEHIWAHKPSPRYRLVLFVRLFLCALVLDVLLVAVVLLVPHSWRMLTMWIAVGIGDTSRRHRGGLSVSVVSHVEL